MKENEAREILAMARGATTQWPVDDDTVTFWLHSLSSLDAEVATKAVMLGAKTWDKFPAWSSFYEAYRAVQRQAQVNERNARDIAEGRRGYATPEWVWVWLWARIIRSPREDRSFPQQGDYGDPMSTMTMEQYSNLREEWITAGSPKKKADVLKEMA